ncbi:hypothetical protein C5167_048646 [Papaver somniferum]|uniref:Uncharacterized protein n=1 Tax=Papaver somniferum TaxID=3469 RepID=A0A4Y7KJX1_PAPSO|nr:casein kinase 1-like [Papaver somniferum]RZC73166.1 hypothetical protein C5167_048646 [Papaver somniferum]
MGETDEEATNQKVWNLAADLCDSLQTVVQSLRTEASYKDYIKEIDEAFPLEASYNLPLQGLKAGTKKQKHDETSEKKMLAPTEVCKSYPVISTIAYHCGLRISHTTRIRRGFSMT